MLLGFTVITDPDQQQVSSILRHLGGILLATDLIQGGVGVLVHLEFNHDGRGVHVLARNQHNVRKAFAGGQLLVGNVTFVFPASRNSHPLTASTFRNIVK